MNPVLVQLSVLSGGCMALISLAINLSRRMELFTAVFRSALVFGGTIAVVLLFLRLFALVLTRYVAEQVLEQRRQAEQAKATDRAPEAGASAAGGR